MLNEDVYTKLNEGLGGCYERIAYTNVMTQIMKRLGCKSLLELNATYIAGIPAFNSVIFAQEGYQVTITVRHRDYEDALVAWELVGLRDKVNILQWTSDTETPFQNGQFDMVWNHLAFDQYKDPVPMVKEMARLSNKAVMNLTLTPYNYGFFLHWIMHRIGRKPYDHGYPGNSLISTMKRVHKECGLSPIESGGVDCPPWMDTVDEQIGESMTYLDLYPKRVRSKWVWCSANPACRDHKLVKTFWSWESSMPRWFKVLMAHHLYVASVKHAC